MLSARSRFAAAAARGRGSHAALGAQPSRGSTLLLRAAAARCASATSAGFGGGLWCLTAPVRYASSSGWYLDAGGKRTPLAVPTPPATLQEALAQLQARPALAATSTLAKAYAPPSLPGGAAKVLRAPPSPVAGSGAGPGAASASPSSPASALTPPPPEDIAVMEESFFLLQCVRAIVSQEVWASNAPVPPAAYAAVCLLLDKWWAAARALYGDVLVGAHNGFLDAPPLSGLFHGRMHLVASAQALDSCGAAVALFTLGTGLPLDLATCNRLARLASISSLPAALAAFNTLGLRGLAPSLDSYAIAVEACIRHGAPTAALPFLVAATARGWRIHDDLAERLALAAEAAGVDGKHPLIRFILGVKAAELHASMLSVKLHRRVARRIRKALEVEAPGATVRGGASGQLEGGGGATETSSAAATSSGSGAAGGEVALAADVDAEPVEPSGRHRHSHSCTHEGPCAHHHHHHHSYPALGRRAGNLWQGDAASWWGSGVSAARRRRPPPPLPAAGSAGDSGEVSDVEPCTAAELLDDVSPARRGLEGGSGAGRQRNPRWKRRAAGGGAAPPGARRGPRRAGGRSASSTLGAASDEATGGSDDDRFDEEISSDEESLEDALDELVANARNEDDQEQEGNNAARDAGAGGAGEFGEDGSEDVDDGDDEDGGRDEDDDHDGDDEEGSGRSKRAFYVVQVDTFALADALSAAVLKSMGVIRAPVGKGGAPVAGSGGPTQQPLPLPDAAAQAAQQALLQAVASPALAARPGAASGSDDTTLAPTLPDAAAVAALSAHSASLAETVAKTLRSDVDRPGGRIIPLPDGEGSDGRPTLGGGALAGIRSSAESPLLVRGQPLRGSSLYMERQRGESEGEEEEEASGNEGGSSSSSGSGGGGLGSLRRRRRDGPAAVATAAAARDDRGPATELAASSAGWDAGEGSAAEDGEGQRGAGEGSEGSDGNGAGRGRRRNGKGGSSGSNGSSSSGDGGVDTRSVAMAVSRAIEDATGARVSPADVAATLDLERIRELGGSAVKGLGGGSGGGDRSGGRGRAARRRAASSSEATVTEDDTPRFMAALRLPEEESSDKGGDDWPPRPSSSSSSSSSSSYPASVLHGHVLWVAIGRHVTNLVDICAAVAAEQWQSKAEAKIIEAEATGALSAAEAQWVRAKLASRFAHAQSQLVAPSLSIADAASTAMLEAADLDEGLFGSRSLPRSKQAAAAAAASSALEALMSSGVRFDNPRAEAAGEGAAAAAAAASQPGPPPSPACLRVLHRALAHAALETSPLLAVGSVAKEGTSVEAPVGGPFAAASAVDTSDPWARLKGKSPKTAVWFRDLA